MTGTTDLPRPNLLPVYGPCVGHATVHLLTGLFASIVLLLEEEWGRPYAQIIRLWTAGALLMGLGAPVAGWIADRFGRAGLVAAFFLISGAAAILAGCARTPFELGASLTLLGLGAALLHPAATAWLLAEPGRKGTTLAWFGICGDLGLAAAAPLALALGTGLGWRFAFILPGLGSVGLGLILIGALAKENGRSGAPVAAPGMASAANPSGRRAVAALTVATFCTALTGSAMALVMPKWFVEQLHVGGPAAVGVAVGAVYLLASPGQLVTGHLSRRFPVKWLYLGAIGVELGMLLLASTQSGWAVLAIAVTAALASSATLPAETILVAGTASPRHYGTVFGLRYVLGFCAAPAAVELVAALTAIGPSVAPVFMGLAVIAGLGAVAVILLPAAPAGRS